MDSVGTEPLSYDARLTAWESYPLHGTSFNEKEMGSLNSEIASFRYS